MYLQVFEMGRVEYECLQCREVGVSTINRKGRIEDHVLKYHLPLDKVPYYCTLCLFRCTEWATLVHHVTKYSRHTQLAKAQTILDHTPFLIQSKKPETIDERYMVPVTEEDAEAQNSVECGMLVGDVPRHRPAIPIPQVPATAPKAPAVPNVSFTASTVAGPHTSTPRQATPLVQEQQTTSNAQSLPLVANPLFDLMEEISTFMPEDVTTTPLRDETSKAPHEGRLHIDEATQTDEPSPKRARLEDTISEAIADAAKQISEAVDRNSRAIRCHDANTTKLMGILEKLVPKLK